MTVRADPPWRETLAAWAPGLAFSALLYLGIDAFERGMTTPYNLLVTGHMLTAAAVLLMVALWQGQRLVVDPRLGRAVLLLTGAAALSTAMAPVPAAALERLQVYAATLALGVGLYLVVRRRADEGLGAFLLGVPLVHALVLGSILLWLFWARGEGTSVVWNVPQHANLRHVSYHGYVAAALGTTLAVLRPRLRVTALLLAAVALFGILVLGSRAALLAWGVFAAAAVLGSRRRGLPLLLCGGVLVAAIAAAWVTNQRELMPVRGVIDRAASGVQSAVTLSEREKHWQAALKAVAERPLFGYGPEAFMKSGCCDPTRAQPHNAIVQFLLEFGVIGFAALAAAAALAVRAAVGSLDAARRRLGDSPAFLWLTATLAGFGAYAMIDGVLYHAIPLMLFAMLAALWCAAARASPPDAADDAR
jgi:hypothetical protein